MNADAGFYRNPDAEDRFDGGVPTRETNDSSQLWA